MARSLSQDSSSVTADSVTPPSISKGNVKYSEYPFDKSSNDDAMSDADTLDPAWTENTNVPRRNVGIIQVASLCINQMVGIGIMQLPSTVLAITGSKPLTIGLWVLGGVYTFISGIMFVEYSSAYPFTGGPLIWFDEIFHKPAMLAANIFAWYWTILATMGNTIPTAVAILSLIWPETSTDDFDDGLVRLVSVFVLTIICLMLYFARRVCFMFNSAFALFKIMLVVVVFIAGLAYATRHRSTSGLNDFSTQHPSGGSYAKLGAMIYVCYTYQGWEHTNYIAGEIKNPRKSLRSGVFFATLIVTFMYTIALVGMFAALPYEDIVNVANPINRRIGFSFTNKVFGTNRGMPVVNLISSGSCVLATVYTASKVRQAIAWQHLMPFYKFIGRQDRQFDSPGGALFVTWLLSTLQTAVVPTASRAAQIWGYLYTYGYEIELAILAFGLLWLQKRKRVEEEGWKFQNIPNKIFLVLIVTFLIGFNLMVLICVGKDRTMGVSNFWMAVCLGSIVLAATVHWGILRLMSLRTADGRTAGQKYFGLEVKIHVCGDDDSEMSDSLKALMREARADGTCRRIEYRVHGRLRWTIDKASEWLQFLGRWLE